MLEIKRILCPVDFSEFSAAAYEYGHSLARHYQAKLFIQHVGELFISVSHQYVSQPLIDQVYAYQVADAEEKIRELAARRSLDEVEYAVVLERGHPADCILEFADLEKMDLIVMGAHGKRGLDRLVLGSVTERVLRKAHCPVLVVPPLARETPGTGAEPVQFRKILYCTDFNEDSPRALEYALLLACQYKAELSLLHVLERASEQKLESERQQALQQLKAAIPENVHTCGPVGTAVRAGKPYEQILEDAADTGSDLIIMGVRGRSAVNLALFGSTTHRVIQLGSCPVLVVRT
jgi:nucleotide-binding universal stress UspA family protein